ncbi:MAG: hypothetical protein ACAI43_03750, partial [Phycisphaerae bacterium]
MVARRTGLVLLSAAAAVAGCGTTAVRPAAAAADEIPESELRVGNGPMRTEPPVPAPDVMPDTRWLWGKWLRPSEFGVPPAQ